MPQKLLGRRSVLSAKKNKGKFTWQDCSLLAPSRSRCGGWGGTSKGDSLKSGAEPRHPGGGEREALGRGQVEGRVDRVQGRLWKKGRPAPTDASRVVRRAVGGHVSAMVMGAL